MVLPTKFLKQTKQLELTMAQMSQDCLKRIVDINFETLCIGEEYELSGYPTFNGPIEILSSVNKAGFDWWSLSSNHSMDRGAEGLLTQIDLVRKNYPDVITTGSHTSQKDKKRTLVKRNQWNQSRISWIYLWLEWI